MKITKFDEINSTNEYLSRKIHMEEFEVVIAKKQTSGKGKRGRVWISNEGAALFSFSVKFDEMLQEKITIFTGYIVYSILLNYLSENQKEKLTFKWPNDIYYENKKICGILCEKIRDFIIVGIGINVNNTDFGIFSEKAISLYEITGKEEEPDKIIEEIVTMFIDEVGSINRKWDKILQTINEKSYLKNKKIKIKTEFDVGERIYKFIRVDRTGRICLMVKGDPEESAYESLDFEIID